jgi:predicted DNA-binding protein (MmcQ/YjbR family)
MRAICLALPDTKETLTWGQPHFRVNDKIFSGYGMENGKASIGFKLEMDHADLRVQDPRFSRAPYVGHKGWVSMDPRTVTDWNEVAAMITSYRSSPTSDHRQARRDGRPPRRRWPWRRVPEVPRMMVAARMMRWWTPARGDRRAETRTRRRMLTRLSPRRRSRRSPGSWQPAKKPRRKKPALQRRSPRPQSRCAGEEGEGKKPAALAKKLRRRSLRRTQRTQAPLS